MGAGGSNGGSFRFLFGLMMMVAGGYLLLSAVQVAWGSHLFHVSGVGITTGYVFIPFVIGVVLLFMNARNPLGWVLAVGSIVMLVTGVVVNTRFVLRPLTAFELISILVLLFGGVGLFLSSFRRSDSEF